MSSKKLKKYGNIDIPAQSLHPPDKDGYLTKQGGSIKTWKRRYFILKDRTLYYFKTPKDMIFTGKIDLEPHSLVKEEQGKKKPNLFSITTAKRIFFMYPDNAQEVKSWVDSISRSIDRLKGNGHPMPVASPSITPSPTPSPAHDRHNGEMIKSPRVKLSLAKHQISFLKDEDSKVLEFWQIWSESIPAREDLSPGMAIDFTVATSADQQKLTWRTSGPQNIFIQKMVDFFWNVGAPESEIDRLNDVGALINPVRIGSWIDMSSKGGMDGGWFFPVDIPLKLAVEAADAGDAIKKFSDWAESHNIVSVYAVGRDMGAAPPRQTEVRLRIPGPTGDAQVQLGVEAFTAFDFPPLPDVVLSIIKMSRSHDGASLSVITSSEGFVRLGLMVPKPSTETVLQLLDFAGGNKESMALFEGSLHSSGPSWVEYQYLQKGFGYGVYKEGFDIVFHYEVGEEMCE
jgi:hypothetical protein